MRQQDQSNVGWLVGCNGALRRIDSISVIRDDTQFLLISRINLIHNFMYACEVRVCFMVCFVLARTQGDFKVLAHRVSTPQTSVPLPQSHYTDTG